MAYTKQTFTAGQTLTAENMNHIEDGLKDLDEGKQEKLVSGTNLKTVNGKSLLGSGDIPIEGGSGGSSVSQAINYDLNVKAINHRGYSAESPENTIPAYIMSKQKGFTYVECDVSFTSDGVAVLLHDATIDRTSNGSGSISNMTYAKALTYDFGSWFSADFAGVKIPTFTEFIMTCKGLGLHPYIELKSNGSYTQAQITQIVDEVELCGMTGKVTYISFNNTYLEYVKNTDPDARLGLLANPINSTKISQAVALKTSTNDVFMDAKLSTVTTSLLKSCITNGLPLEVWTVNTEDEIRSMPNYVTGVTSDYLVAGKVLYEKYATYTPPSAEDLIPATSISLSKTSISFTSISTQTLSATVTPSNSTDTVIWKSSNTAVATVSNGVVTPVKDGTCTITATAGSVSASCSVTVDIPNSFSITRNLVGCKTDSSVNLVIEGEAHTETFSLLNDGYSFDGATVSVTMGGQDISNLVVDNVLTIPSVTGDVVINITAKEVATYSITRNLVGCRSNSTATVIKEGGALTESITVINDSYTLEGVTVSVTMGGEDISNQVVDGVLTIASVTGDVVISATANLTNTSLPYPVVDLALSNVTDGIIVNGGTGGATYDTTVKNGEYTSDENGISLLTTAYASTPYALKGTQNFTLCARGSFDELNSSNAYQRFVRGDQDVPSLFNRKTDGRFCAKLIGSSSPTIQDHSDLGEANSSQNNWQLYPESVGTDQHTYVWVCDPTTNTISFYFDGQLCATQGSATNMKSASSIGIGNTSPSDKYYANKITVSKFQVYDQALSAEAVAML